MMSKDNKTSKVNEVLDCFNKGFSCSQAVFSSYCEQFGLDKKTANKLSCGLGAGMGRLGETCGAVTASYLLIGLKYGKYLEKDDEAKENTYRLVREFERRFVERNKTTSCRELLGVDLLRGDKQKVAQRVKEVCPKAVKDAAEIIESILRS